MATCACGRSVFARGLCRACYDAARRVVDRSEAEMLAALASPGYRAPRARNPAGAFVVIAANLGASVADTAAAIGLPEDEVRALANRPGAHVTHAVLERLGAWVAVCLLRVVDAQDTPEVSDQTRGEVLAMAWGGPPL